MIAFTCSNKLNVINVITFQKWCSLISMRVTMWLSFKNCWHANIWSPISFSHWQCPSGWDFSFPHFVGVLILDLYTHLSLLLRLSNFSYTLTGFRYSLPGIELLWMKLHHKSIDNHRWGLGSSSGGVNAHDDELYCYHPKNKPILLPTLAYERNQNWARTSDTHFHVHCSLTIQDVTQRFNKWAVD
jgi:hypothetical protein